MQKRQKEIVYTLESKGYYTLADSFREIIASKEIRRKSKVKAINIAAKLRDQLEAMSNKLLKSKIGDNIKDVSDLLEADFDRLEEKFAKILAEYLEFKSNQEKYQPDEIEKEEQIEKEQIEIEEPQYKSDIEIEPIQKEEV